MSNLENVFVVGLAAGYITYLVVDSSSMPQWWYRFRDWWRDKFFIGKAFHGKPFTCNLCMSFWVSVALILIQCLWIIGDPQILLTLTFRGLVYDIVFAFACAGVAYLVDRLLDRLNTTIIMTG